MLRQSSPLELKELRLNWLELKLLQFDESQMVDLGDSSSSGNNDSSQRMTLPLAHSICHASLNTKDTIFRRSMMINFRKELMGFLTASINAAKATWRNVIGYTGSITAAPFRTISE